MPISKGDHLFVLVKSLSKAEKRVIRAYSTRFQDADSLLYLQLFDLLDNQQGLDEEALVKKLGLSDRNRYSNLKRHLYRQILSGLRIIHLSKDTEIQIRELIDFSDILYSRGLYLQSLRLLEKAKNLASKNGDDILYLNVVEKEKMIESRHITRSGPTIISGLVEVTDKAANYVSGTTRLSNLRIMLHGYYIQKGHVKTLKEEEEVKAFF